MNCLELPAIPATSPTLAETMRLCPLRAGLSRATGSTTFVLGSPRAWLGTAYHQVLERIRAVDPAEESADSAAERLWSQAVTSQYQRMTNHPLDRRFGLPETWPGYYLARASALLRARELMTALAKEPHTGGAAVGASEFTGSMRERSFAAFAGKLVGRPDLIQGSEIVDYKSGAVLEYDEVAQTDVVKAAYIRQLRIYGFLVKETLGWWPKRGLLLPLAGAAVEVALDPGNCTHEANEAVALLDAYNRAIRTEVDPPQLAMPSVEACSWCPFKTICPRFWEAVSPAWSNRLDGVTIEGDLIQPPAVVHGGAAMSLSVRVWRGSAVDQEARISPLNLNVHPLVGQLVAGDRVRVIGLRSRSDGGLLPTLRTVMTRVDQTPDLAFANAVAVV